MTRFRGALVGVGLAMLVLLPSAAAREEAAGTLSVQGPVLFLDGGLAEVPGLRALFLPDTSSGASLRLEADVAELCHSEVRFVFAPNGAAAQDPRRKDDCQPRTGLRLASIAGADNAGHVGIYLREGARASFEPLGGWSGESRTYTRLASLDARGGSTPAEERERYDYVSEVSGEHVLATGPGTVHATGGLGLTVAGFELRATSREGEEVYATGVERVEGLVQEEIIRWVYVRTSSAVLHLSAPVPVAMAAQAVEARAAAEVRFLGTGGSIVSAEAVYAPNRGRQDHVEGVFASALRGTASGEGRLSFQGQLAATSLQRAPLPVGVPAVAESLAPLLVGLATTGGTLLTAGLVLLQRRRVEQEVLYYTYYVEMAEAWGDFEAALAWLEPAIALAPRDAELRLWEAMLHRNLGMHGRAIAAGEAAAAVLPRTVGKADYYVAAFCMEAGDDSFLDQARVHLERALRREPGLAGTIERDPLFHALHGPEFRAMLEEAFARAAREEGAEA